MELMIFVCSMQTINDFCVSFSLGTNITIASIEVQPSVLISFSRSVRYRDMPPIKLLYRSSGEVIDGKCMTGNDPMVD